MKRLSFAFVLLAACGMETPPGPPGPDGGDSPLEPWVDDFGTSGDFLDSDLVVELELLIEDDAIASLRAEPRTYVPAMIVFDGKTIGPVGVRLKGQNSFQPIDDKPSLRVNVDEYVPDATFFNLKDLTFNNMSSDPSQLHERLAYKVAREAGIPASRANHAVLTINGEPYGLYTNVETVKEQMINEWFDDDEGPLFEATDVDFTPQLVGGYELDDGPDERAMLDGLAGALASPNADQAIAAAAQYIDIDHFQRYWAMSSVIGQFDAFPFSDPGDDYFVYADPTSQKLWLIPWGMDETFFAADFSPLQVKSVLAKQCMASPACYDRYQDLVWETVTMIEDMGLEAWRAQLEAEIAPLIAADTKRPFTDEEIAEGQRQLGYFIRGRRTTMGWYLTPPM